MPTETKTYLGDSVYADMTDIRELVLTTENGFPDDPSNMIHLDAGVLRSLVAYLKTRYPLIMEPPHAD